MKLYLFNPDTDMALAANQPNYMAPENVREMMADLALLPLWYAEPGSAILAPSAYNDRFLQQMKERFALDVRLITEPELGELTDLEPMPWGWNLSLRKRLLQAGIAEASLPSLPRLDGWRHLSSREQTNHFLTLFAGKKQCIGEVEILTTVEACHRVVERWTTCLFKTPWSSSGKGLNWCRRSFTPQIEQWCVRTLKEQGLIVASPIYNKVKDLAMEFCLDGHGGVQFVGYSLFKTNQSGAYQGNYLYSDAEIEHTCLHTLPSSLLQEVREIYEAELQPYALTYRGVLGVDMMLVEERGEYALHPCVEMNLRMNMGLLSNIFCRRYVGDGSTGFLEIRHYNSPEELQQAVRQLSEENPLLMSGRRILSGFMPLTPVTPRCRNLAYALIADREKS